MFVFQEIQISLSKATVIATCTFPAKQSKNLPSICKDSHSFSNIYLHAYMWGCCGTGLAEMEQSPEQQLMCSAPGQMSSHKTIISVIRQAPVFVQEEQQCPQLVSGPYILAL